MSRQDKTKPRFCGALFLNKPDFYDTIKEKCYENS